MGTLMMATGWWFSDPDGFCVSQSSHVLPGSWKNCFCSWSWQGRFTKSTYLLTEGKLQLTRDADPGLHVWQHGHAQGWCWIGFSMGFPSTRIQVSLLFLVANASKSAWLLENHSGCRRATSKSWTHRPSTARREEPGWKSTWYATDSLTQDIGHRLILI